MPEALFVCFFSLFSVFSVWVIFIALYCSSLILSSVLSILLLNSLIEFGISVNVFFSSKVFFGSSLYLIFPC